MLAQISIDCTRPLIIFQDETKEKIAELVGLNKSTVQEILRSYVDRLDFKSYRAAHKPRLTARHCKSRLRWAKEHIQWIKDQWRNVVWSAESCFCMEDIKWGGGGAMVWDAF
ncbi:hypothetical protein G6F37_001574 [Rhizopus arrhizus]|nr:hypothetical protein G6F38_001357 [Rhizopus arrhizus]KAG1163048.1 hypothetical protein G6F37_001574 [Rhizopus arrhizus]